MSSNNGELFFGIVGAVGSDIDFVCRSLESELRKAQYSTFVIHLSRLLGDCHRWLPLKKTFAGPEDQRISQHMTAGDELRAAARRGDAMVLLGIDKITAIRSERGNDSFQPLTQAAYIFRSLKHPDEVRTLRELYGNSFFLVSVYTPRQMREEMLAQRISRSRGEYGGGIHQESARSLMERDEKEDNVVLGQSVRDTFYLADLFVDGSNSVRAGREIERFVEILFGNPFRTPTVDEYAMFIARASGMRSADLSRQVGAVIIRDEGEIVGAGCNEVPKAGGGIYWESIHNAEPNGDYRDFVIGYDSTARMKREILSEMIDRFREANWLHSDIESENASRLVERALGPGTEAILKGSRIDSILEFGRIVHAELTAITEAARRGLSTAETTMYCTTFPCHMCARHIVACGIMRVVYIEPYPKSLAKELYARAIRVDHDTEADENAVSFEPFVGVAPRRFREFFEMVGSRKDDRGYRVAWTIASGVLRVREFPTYTDKEKAFMAYLNDNAASLGIRAPSKQAGETG